LLLLTKLAENQNQLYLEQTKIKTAVLEPAAVAGLEDRYGKGDYSDVQ
jgi:hypothetical protein